MADFAEKREIQFITIYVIVMIFLGISKETTRFIFPGMGDKVYTVINFYFLSTIALMVIITWLAQNHTIPSLPKVPPLWAIAVNFLVFFPLFYIFWHLIWTGSASVNTIKVADFVIENVISFNENYIAFILLPTLLPWGKGIGSLAQGNILTIRGYTMRYDVPTLSRMKYGLPGITIISLLHVGSYSQNVNSFGQFYTVLFIAFVMFFFMYGIKETFSFGASEAAHSAWNLSLLSIRGSVI